MIGVNSLLEFKSINSSIIISFCFKMNLNSFSHRYVAPEYASSGKLTERSDVYSYGVVLLELITGRKAVDASQTMGNESLVEWVTIIHLLYVFTDKDMI